MSAVCLSRLKKTYSPVWSLGKTQFTVLFWLPKQLFMLCEVTIIGCSWEQLPIFTCPYHCLQGAPVMNLNVKDSSKTFSLTQGYPRLLLEISLLFSGKNFFHVLLNWMFQSLYCIQLNVEANTECNPILFCKLQFTVWRLLAVAHLNNGFVLKGANSSAVPKHQIRKQESM